MPLPAALALAAAVPGIAQAGLGIWQGIRGRKLGQTERPEYQIPESIKRLVQLSGAEAGRLGLPGEQGIKSDLTASTARGVNELTKVATGGDLLGAATKVVSSEQDALTNLGIAGADYSEKRKADYIKALSELAGYEEKAFQWNEMQPYIQAQEQAMALKDAAIKNITGGVTSGITGLSQTQMQLDYLDYLKNKGLSSTDLGSSITDSGSSIFLPSQGGAAFPTLDASLYSPSIIQAVGGN